MQIFLFLLLRRALLLSINILHFLTKSEIAANDGISSLHPHPFPSFSKGRFPPQKQCAIFKSLDADDLFVAWHAQSPELTYDLLIIYERTDSCELWCFCKYHDHSSVNACSVWSYSHTQFLWDLCGELNTEIQVTSSQDPSTLIYCWVYQDQGYLVPLGSFDKSKSCWKKQEGRGKEDSFPSRKN